MDIITTTFYNDNYNLAICICPPDTLKHTPLQDKMMEYTKFYAHRLNQLVHPDNLIKIYESTHIDSAMVDLQDKHEYVLILSAGLKITDMSLLFDVKNIIDNEDDFLVAGVVRDGQDTYCEIHHSFLLVDVKRWCRAGSPCFGGWENEVKELPVVDKKITDNYVTIEFTGEKKEQHHMRQGWGYIEAAGNNEMRVVSIPPTKKYEYCYPEHRSIEFWDNIQKPEKDIDLLIVQKNVISQIRSVNFPKIWLTNTESIDFEIYNHPYYDTVALPASGFKMINAVNYMNDAGELIIYDYNQISLDWAKFIYESEDTDISNLIKIWEGRKHFFVAGSKVFSDKECTVFTKEALASIERSIAAFGTGQNLFTQDFEATLKKFRSVKVKFLLCDLFNNPESLTSHFTGNSLVSVSNIFSTDFSAINQPVFENQKCLGNFVKSINVPARILGQDAYCRRIDKEINSGN